MSTAVAGLGGTHRPGQLAMAEAVADTWSRGDHLLVQAGTGTGKSLAYLIPALQHERRVVVATATLALQHQLVERDLPRLVASVDGFRSVSYAVLKGRSNYACLHRVRAGVPDEQDSLLDAPSGSLGEAVVALRTWAEEDAATGGTGERDRAPRHLDRAWRQVSVTHRECLGSTRCPFGLECFAERAKERAQRAHLVVTNHSLLAIDAVQGVPMLPDYDAVVVDEAHELVARITQAATDELAVADVTRASQRVGRVCPGDDEATALAEAADLLADAIAGAAPGHLRALPESMGVSLARVRDAARAAVSAVPKDPPGAEPDAGRATARAAAQDVFTVAERMCAGSESDVLWLTEAGRYPARLCIAPLQVTGQMRTGLLTDKSVVFTSATLTLGGDFSAMAQTLGLRPTERLDSTEQQTDDLAWRGLDVGSPFDYRRQAIIYTARRLPAPGRDGLGEAQLAEIVALVDAAGGGALGLFSSRRAAETAAERVRLRLPHLTTLAQGDAQLPELAALFAADRHSCLFGTLSLWQGIDIPGDSCQLVLIDRIPFPRPDDPLMSARQRAIEKSGGNGFMAIAATHAALLLAQGAGRLIRTSTDRGVVAILDPRLATARYGGFLRASLPPMWQTTDPTVVRAALARLAADRSGGGEAP